MSERIGGSYDDALYNTLVYFITLHRAACCVVFAAYRKTPHRNVTQRIRCKRTLTRSATVTIKMRRQKTSVALTKIVVRSDEAVGVRADPFAAAAALDGHQLGVTTVS